MREGGRDGQSEGGRKAARWAWWLGNQASQAVMHPVTLRPQPSTEVVALEAENIELVVLALTSMRKGPPSELD